jgi:hypothetical protein
MNNETLIDVFLLILSICAPIVIGGLVDDAFYPAIVITAIVLIIISLRFIHSKLIKVIAIVLTVLLTMLAIGYQICCRNRPQFDINFLGLPYDEENFYYVSNSMINTKGDLSAYGDFTLIPMEVEVIPRYSGNDKFGNVVLKVTGRSESKVFPLWSDFDRTAQSQTMSISPGEIVTLSEIRTTPDKVETNLMLEDNPYPEAKLTFQIVPLSDLDKPFAEEQTLWIKNTPWIQSTRITGRNGLGLDYALKNLGATATFHCRLTLAIIGEIGAIDHDFWSGVEVFNYGPNCAPFTLETGETYSTTIPLNEETLGKELPRGRYLAQVYTFAEREDIELGDTVTYENSNDIWVFANTSDVLTFVVCNDPGKSCEDSITFPVERATIRAFSYDSSDSTGNGYTYLRVNTYQSENHITNQYVLDYQLDPAKDGWVGFAFVFEEPIDLSYFDAVRFKIQLDESIHPLWFQMTSSVNNEDTNYRVKIGESGYGKATSDEQTIIISYDAFQGIDWTSVYAINIIVDDYMVPDVGLHQLKISEIEFVRE